MLIKIKDNLKSHFIQKWFSPWLLCSKIWRRIHLMNFSRKSKNMLFSLLPLLCYNRIRLVILYPPSFNKKRMNHFWNINRWIISSQIIRTYIIRIRYYSPNRNIIRINIKYLINNLIPDFKTETLLPMPIVLIQ